MDAVILPGGMGVFKNLTTYISQREEYNVNNSIDRLIKNMYLAKKPIGGMCGAVLIIVKSLSEEAKDLKVTNGIGGHYDRTLSKLGCYPISCEAEECYVDLKNKVVTTPAFLASQNLHKIMTGIDKMVMEVVNLK